MDHPFSPPRIKNPPQLILTAPDNNNVQIENTAMQTTNTYSLITIPNSEEDIVVINLQRNLAGMFDVTKCLTCPTNTQHRCTFPC